MYIPDTATIQTLRQYPTNYWSQHLVERVQRLPEAQRAAAASAIRGMASTLRDLSPLQKTALLYRLVTRNISYDYAALTSANGGSHIAYDYTGALTGQAVCSGISELLMLLMSAADLEAITVVGVGDNAKRAGLHAWNKVRLCGDWYNLDATWDLKRAQPLYFLRSDPWMEAHGHYVLPDRYPSAPAAPDPTLRLEAEKIFELKGMDKLLCRIWQSFTKATQ